MIRTSVQRVYLRFHARLILGTTILIGFASTHYLLKFTQMEIVIRYPLSAFFAYLAFLIQMFLWKKYLERLPPVHNQQLSGKNTKVMAKEKRWTDYLDISELPGDWDEALIAIGVFVLFFVLLYFASLLVYEIPLMMIEIVLAGAFSSILSKPIQKADDNIFVFKLVHHTFLYGLALVLSYLLIGVIILIACPAAKKLSDVFVGACTN